MAADVVEYLIHEHHDLTNARFFYNVDRPKLLGNPLREFVYQLSLELAVRLCFVVVACAIIVLIPSSFFSSETENARETSVDL